MKRSKNQTPSSREAPNIKLQTRRVRLVLVLGLFAFGPGLWTAFAAQNSDSAPSRTDYRNFEIIPKKNIFNPRRSPAYVPQERPQTVRRRSETLALVGVMSYGKGPMAFFDGSRSDYRKVLKTNDSVAGFKVTSIDSSSVKLASNTNEIEMQLGMQLAREDEGEWKLSARPESLENYARATPMRTASQVNSDRAAEADQNANPFANAIGNFFGNRGGGFPFPGGGNFPTQTTPADTQTQPTVTAAPANAGDILARLAARRAQETGGEPPPENQPAAVTPDQGTPNPRGPSPQNQTPPSGPQNAQPPIVQPGQPPIDQPDQPQFDQSGRSLDQPNQQPVDQFGRPILIQPEQAPPNQ
jgi:hypothetical protein